MATDVQIVTRKLASVNPATGEVLQKLDCAAEQQVLSAVELAAVAQPAWANLGLRKRIDILRNFQSKLHAGKNEVAAAITREAGKPVAEALVTEVLVVHDSARFLIDNAFTLLRDENVPPSRRSTEAEVVCQSSEAAFHCLMSSGVV